jgi:L-Ala-D/L-Glu epimerase
MSGPESPGPLTLRVAIENWPLVEPFRITGYTWESWQTLLVSVEKEGCVGLGEAAGVHYRKDTPASMLRQIESLRLTIEAGVSRVSVQRLLPPGGARNALDCALWDLESKLAGRPAWQLADIDEPRPLLTTFTCGAAEPDSMAAAALGYSGARAIKLKLTGEAIDAERVCAVRAARKDVWLCVDANQGFTPGSLEHLMPVLVEANVALIEQPFPFGQERLLDGFRSPIAFAADESAQCLADIPTLEGRFQVVNIKLDKCGGLTEGLMGTSLAMAPAFLLGQLCDVVDLDGPVFLKGDRALPVRYVDGHITCPRSLWGHPGV